MPRGRPKGTRGLCYGQLIQVLGRSKKVNKSDEIDDTNLINN